MPPPPKLEISLALLVQVGVVLAGAVGFVVLMQGRSEGMQRELTSLQVETTRQIAGMRIDMLDGLKDIRSQISVIPDQTARINQLERRLLEVDNRSVALDARVQNAERDNIELRARFRLGSVPR